MSAIGSLSALETLRPGWMKPRVTADDQNVTIKASCVDSVVRSALLHGGLNASETPGDRLNTDVFNGLENFTAKVPMRDGSIQEVPMDYTGSRPTDSSPGYRIQDNFEGQVPRSQVDLNALADPAVGIRVYAQLQGNNGDSGVVPANVKPLTL